MNLTNAFSFLTYLRSTMSHCRLNNLFLLYVHAHKTDALDLKNIADEFVSINSRRMNYFEIGAPLGKIIFLCH